MVYMYTDLKLANLFIGVPDSSGKRKQLTAKFTLLLSCQIQVVFKFTAKTPSRLNARKSIKALHQIHGVENKQWCPKLFFHALLSLYKRKQDAANFMTA